MKDLVNEVKGYDINFSYKGKMFHINSHRLEQNKEKLKEFGIEVYQWNGVNCIYLPDEKRAIGEIVTLPFSIRLALKMIEACIDLSYAFSESVLPKSFDLNGWDVSQCTKFCGMFFDCSSLETVDLSNWNVNNAENFETMFCFCSSLTFLDLSGWDISNGKKFANMFHGCRSLKTVKAEGCNDFTIAKLKKLVPEGCEVVY